MQKANERRKNEEKYTRRKIQICANRSNGGEELISGKHTKTYQINKTERFFLTIHWILEMLFLTTDTTD